MGEWEARYQRYSLDQLEDAIGHIDRERYPERAQLLEDLIAKRRELPRPQVGGEQDPELNLLDLAPPIPTVQIVRPSQRLPRWMTASFRWVRISSLVIGLVSLVSVLTDFDIALLSVWVNTMPHAARSSGMDPSRLATLVVALFLFVGGFSFLRKWRPLTPLLSLAWGIASIRIFATHIVWAPELPQRISFSLELNLGVNDWPNVFELFLVPLGLCVWSIMVARWERRLSSENRQIAVASGRARPQ